MIDQPGCMAVTGWRRIGGVAWCLRREQSDARCLALRDPVASEGLHRKRGLAPKGLRIQSSELGRVGPPTHRERKPETGMIVRGKPCRRGRQNRKSVGSGTSVDR